MILPIFVAFLAFCSPLCSAKFQNKVFYNTSELFVEGNTLTLKNSYRDNALLKFTVNGANIERVSNYRGGYYDIQLDNFNSFFIEEKDLKTKVRELSIRWDTGPLYQREVCFHYGFNDASWYSTYEEIDQHFPMDTKKVQPLADFQTNDYFQAPFGSMIETTFLTSDGFAVRFRDGIPAQVRRDPNNGDPLLCLTCQKEHNNHWALRVDILMSENIRSLYDNITQTHEPKAAIPKPTGIPSEKMFEDPVWSTWVEYKKGVDQEKVLKFSHDISEHGFPASQIEIDDKWEKFYGDLEFDPAKFSDPEAMVKNISALGFPVTLWIHPFVNEDSPQYSKNLDLFVQNANRSGPQLVKWWDGQGAGIDFSNSKAVDWFVDRLKELRNLSGIESFKFDAGERYWYGKDPHFHSPLVQTFQNQITTNYVAAVAKLGSKIEVRSSFHNQDQPIFTRLMDRNANWDEHNGLKSVITGALTFSLAGYSFILPDMIGGNGKQPPAEMYIRWVQASALLPSMQFSITPWRYSTNESGIDVVKVSKTFVDLHKKYSPTIIKLAKERVEKGHPIIRPMWWLEPNDERTYKIGDQFMLGNDIVVAPVMVDKARERSVYLPTGKWKDHRGQEHSGPGVHQSKAELSELPLFTRV